MAYVSEDTTGLISGHNHGVYVVEGHPLTHRIEIRYPKTDPDPEARCVDCNKVVQVRYFDPEWLKNFSLSMANLKYKRERARRKMTPQRADVLLAVGYLDGCGKSGQVYEQYRLVAQELDHRVLKPRRIYSLVNELIEMGYLTAKREYRGRRGITREIKITDDGREWLDEYKE